MFAVNRFVVAPSGTVSSGAQNRGARRSAAAYELTERPQVAGSHRLLLGEMSAALKQQHGGFCSEKLCRCSLQLCRNAISGTTARSLLLGLRHVLFTLVYLISWRKSCMALAGLLLAVAADATT